MYDYVDGKVDWMAYGLPVEGDDGPFLGGQLTEVATCSVTQHVADARRALDSGGDDEVILVDGAGLAVGQVDRDALEGRADDAPLLDVLQPVPSTVRPSVTVASVAEAGGGDRLVTTSDGRLLGRAHVETGDHNHDDHDHDHGEPLDVEGFEAEMTQVMQALAEEFGDREPSADEVRTFLRSRLLAEGRSEEEADQLLDSLDVPGPE